jgi:hypothetical protein
MFEMANLFPQKTGLPVALWFGEVGGQHGPRIKVCNVPGKFNPSNTFVMPVAKTPVLLNQFSSHRAKIDDISDWVKLNYDTLMKMWEIHETEDGDLDAELTKLKKI